MDIERVVVGFLDNNCYLLKKEGKVLIIDPGSDMDKIILSIGEDEPIGIIITHHHFDHDGLSEDFSIRYKIKVYDNNNLDDFNLIGPFEFEVIRTPGHKEDAITIYFRKEKVMFTGDFLFKDDIGRCDLPGGNIKEMKESIEKIKQYPEEVIVYPGHGEKTNLGYECHNNPYFRDYLGE